MDATVRIRGVCGAIFNPRLQIIGVIVHMPSLSELQVIDAAPADPFSMAVRPINSLQRFMQGASGHQTHVRGVVTAEFPGQEFFISDETGGLYVRAREGMPLEPGDHVDVAGFPVVVDGRATLVNAAFHRLRAGAPPKPLPLTVRQALDGEHDSALVQIEGDLCYLTGWKRQGPGVARCGNQFHRPGAGKRSRAQLVARRQPRQTDRHMSGSVRRHRDSAGADLAAAFQQGHHRHTKPVLADAGRALSILGFLGVAIVLALTWIAILRRRVQKQTEIIRTTLESTGDGILVADSRRIPAAYNQRFVEMWRIPKNVLNAGNDHSLLKFMMSEVSDPDAYFVQVKKLYDDGEAHADDVIEFADGPGFEYHSEPLRIGGTPQGRVWGFRDITDRKRAEENRSLQQRFGEGERRAEAVYLHRFA